MKEPTINNPDNELTQAQTDELKTLDVLPEDQIDTSDVPEVRDSTERVQDLLHLPTSARRQPLGELRGRRQDSPFSDSEGPSEWKNHEWAPPTGNIGAYIAEETKKTLDAYRSQPNLVHEHANHEEDTARGGYARRQLFELVQNGADALSESGGGRIWIGLTRNYLYCADAGEPIDQDGVRALMFAYLSPKRGNDEIGRFGLGFKSVLGVTDTPEFFSRSGSFRFDRESAAEKVRLIVPDAERYPVLRLPESIDPYEEMEADSILRELMGWASNIVRLSLRGEAYNNLEDQVDGFPSEFLLFVNHVSELTLQNDISGTTRTFSLTLEDDVYFLSNGNRTTRWMVARDIHQLSSDARSDSRSLDDTGQVPITWAVPLDNLGQPGQFWAFFPTVTSSLVAGILNAPWKTNEDRQNLLEGIYNRELVDAAASLVAKALPHLSEVDDPGCHIDALPRRHESGDNDFSVALRRHLYSKLATESIVPDQNGMLRKLTDISYPPEHITDSALRRWSESETRQRDWLHHSVLTVRGQDRQARLGLTRNSYSQFDWEWPEPRRSTIAEWLEALVKSVKPKRIQQLLDGYNTIKNSNIDRSEKAEILASVGQAIESRRRARIPASQDAVQTASLITEAARQNGNLGSILLTADDKWAEPNPESVFLSSGESSISGTLVHPELQADAETLEALRNLGIKPESPESTFRNFIADITPYVLVPSAENLKLQQHGSYPDSFWEEFWARSREIESRSAAKIIRESRWDVEMPLYLKWEWRRIARSMSPTPMVRVTTGGWRPLPETLLPGPVVPEDGSRDASVTIDVHFHHEDLDLLKELGATDVPRNGCKAPLLLPRHIYLVLTARAEFINRDDLPSRPRREYLKFETATCSGPLDVMEFLSEEGKAEFTWRLLDLDDTYKSWRMQHKTRSDVYPHLKVESPAVRVLREHGRIRTNEGIRRLSDGLGDPPQNSVVLEKLLSHPNAGLIREAFGIPDIIVDPDDDDDYWPPVDKVKAAREVVRSYRSDELRLLAAVGETDLRLRLPSGLVDILEDENGSPLNGIQVAQAAMATFHTGALREYRNSLSHLDPPRRWAGSPGAVAFVKSLGFGEEWAMERNAKRDPYIEVEGPYLLPPLHPYQHQIVSKVREIFKSDGVDTQRRGMISLPTGSGKTRVAVQAVVEAIRIDGYRGGILWVADRDELCEQAVESWSQVWRSEGLRETQLRISRMWGGQPTPLPTPDMHVIVATIQTLSSAIARLPDKYEFLSDFEILIFDEAHRSVAPTFTSVMEELGLTRWRRSDEPILIGLTATPYRGRDERETQRLVNRYGRNRLDEGAFDSDNPEEVIKELQAMGVLAKADHDVIEGGQFRLTGGERRQSENVPWLPQSVEERIAGDAERTRRIVETHRNQVPPTWPTLIFATSVEHSKTIAALLTAKGVLARAVSADTETSVRRRIVEQFRSGEIKVLVNYGIFREGFDAPKTRAIVVARPVYSPNLYFQMVGRGLRGKLNGGNERCLVLNVRDNIENFDRKLAFSELDWLWD